MNQPTYSRQYDDTRVICPYCKYEYQPEPDSYDEDVVMEVCDNCSKKFFRADNISVDHQTIPNCTLNGEKHQYTLGLHSNPDFGYWVCTTCNHTTIKSKDVNEVRVKDTLPVPIAITSPEEPEQ